MRNQLYWSGQCPFTNRSV